MRRRVVAGSPGRRTVTGDGTGTGGADAVTLDDRPLSIVASRDQKRLIVTLPFEVWIVGANNLEVERTIELQSEVPTAHEAMSDGNLWIGGSHLFHGNLFATATTKIGTKLGGYVDRVCLVGPSVLCGVGSHGEVLWDVDKEEALHRRKVSERRVRGLVASPDGRAVFCDGAHCGWVIDPDHPSGYMKLKLKRTSDVEVAAEAIVALGTTSQGHTVLAARDGAVGWTNRALRPTDERFPLLDEPNRFPLAIAGDQRWIYVLRRGNLLQRFLVAQPPPPDEGPEPEPLPDAQMCRLQRSVSCLAQVGDRLVFGGPHADDQLGRLWSAQPKDLPWETQRLGKRRLVEVAPPPESRPPSFVATRTKLTGEPLAQIKVDDVIAGNVPFWVTRGTGTVLERPHARIEADKVMPGDALVLPAMVRFHEGTARPALLVWPGTADHDKEPSSPLWLAWGDEPRAWTPLQTPALRDQSWGRREVFPLQATLRSLPEVDGHRRSLPSRWLDPEAFAALARECKKLLKVLW